MAIKLTKNEQKVQKDHLKQYQRYLPTLQLKKQQLQSVIMKTKAELEQKEVERAQMIGDLVSTLRKQETLLENELRATSQRVNLFEKVKIPEAKENIRVIGVFLGDQQTAAVVRGKISKKKLVEAAK